MKSAVHPPSAPWTRIEDVRAKLLRRWDSGIWLRQVVAGEEFQPVTVRLRAPSANEINDRLDAVRAWVAAIRAGARPRGGGDDWYDIEWRRVGGRGLGSNELPARIRFELRENLFRFLGVQHDADRFVGLVGLARERDMPVQDWLLRSPRRALQIADHWPHLLDAVEWLRANAGRDVYLRQIDVPGVDTKFVERHRKTITALLDQCQAAQVSSRRNDVAARLGLRTRPVFVRSRMLDETHWLADGIGDCYLRVEELASLRPPADQVVIVENEINYLTLPPAERVLAMFGKGYDVERFARLPWLAGLPVVYWGDLDTHGFQILDRLRQHLPHAHSVLMDLDTLLAHPDRWGTENEPTFAPKPRLTAGELTAYDYLIDHGTGDKPLRLEQERIDYGYAARAVLAAVGTPRGPATP
ncbi:MAG: hypothetical protein CSA58_00980 [Micrococcales bacterium]|nr:MAG: hypothetical protein CSA58_00980 [Micrococcales bacterium]